MTELNLYVLSWVISFALAIVVVAGLLWLGNWLYWKMWWWFWFRRWRKKSYIRSRP